MRTALIAWCSVILLSGSAACGSDDTVTEKCSTACEVPADKSACSSWKDKCINDCKALVQQTQNLYGKTCGDCVASTMTYSVKPGCTTADCCWGVTNKTPNDKECQPKCFEPDGSIGW